MEPRQDVLSTSSTKTHRLAKSVNVAPPLMQLQGTSLSSICRGRRVLLNISSETTCIAASTQAGLTKSSYNKDASFGPRSQRFLGEATDCRRIPTPQFCKSLKTEYILGSFRKEGSGPLSSDVSVDEEKPSPLRRSRRRCPRNMHFLCSTRRLATARRRTLYLMQTNA